MRSMGPANNAKRFLFRCMASLDSSSVYPTILRKRPSWQTSQLKESRTISVDAFDMVDELFCAWTDFHEKWGDDNNDILEESVYQVVCATEELFYTDEEERCVYEKLRSRALDVERAVSSMTAVSVRRSSVYDEICFRARELATIE